MDYVAGAVLAEVCAVVATVASLAGLIALTLRALTLATRALAAQLDATRHVFLAWGELRKTIRATRARVPRTEEPVKRLPADSSGSNASEAGSD